MPLRILAPRGVNAREKLPRRGVNARENRHLHPAFAPVFPEASGVQFCWAATVPVLPQPSVLRRLTLLSTSQGSLKRAAGM